MTPDLLTQLRVYGHQLDVETPALSVSPPVRPAPEYVPPARHRWAVAVVAAAAMVVLIGGAAWLLGGGAVDDDFTGNAIPETWTTYTSAADGIVSECLCQMEMAADGSIWIVGWDGISRFDGLRWQRIEPPRPFTGEGWPAVAPSADGSVWVLGMSYIAHYVDGAWEPIIEAGHQEDGGPLTFQGLWIDDDNRVWTDLADEIGVIQNGAFTPMEQPADGDEDIPGLAEPPGGLLAVDASGSYWMDIGDTLTDVAGALIEYHDGQLTYHALGGVSRAEFETDGTGWFLVPEVGSDAWMFGRAQWSEPGLYRRDADEWYRITTADGLPGYRFSAMVRAPDGSLWISTADGTVTRYQPGTNPQSGTVVDIESRPFTEADRPPPAYPPTTVPDG